MLTRSSNPGDFFAINTINTKIYICKIYLYAFWRVTLFFFVLLKHEREVILLQAINNTNF